MADLAERAARLAKADLVTGMVGEFPELQGLMGGYYAAAQGEDPARRRRDPRPLQAGRAGRRGADRAGDGGGELADKLDTIARFFAIDEQPTGSKDPFALRRAALGVIALISNDSAVALRSRG